jgi:hypothetical protein
MSPRAPLLLLAVLAASSAALAHEVDTSREGARLLPLPKEEGVFHFVIFGDRTGGPREGVAVLADAVRDTNLLDPDLVMTVGDLVEGYNTTEKWLEEMKEFRGIMEGLRMAWFPVAGNHDIYWRGPERPPGEHEASYEMHFGPLWYAFSHKNAGFVVLYSDEGNPESGKKGFDTPDLVQISAKQLSWLREALAKLAAKDHVFVFLHHPRWVEQIYRGSNWREVHDILVRAGNVSAVFAGHIHRMRYDGKKDGIEYFALAATGAHISGDYPLLGYLHHFNVVTVRQGSFSVAAVPVGAVMDPRQFTPRRLDDVDRLRARDLVTAPGRLDLGVDGEAAGFYSVRLHNPASLPIEATLTPEGEGDWLLAPDHRHLPLGPEETREVEFAYGRRALGFAALSTPRLALDVDYLEEKARITLPRRVVPFALGLRPLPSDFHAPAPNGVLELSGKTDCLRVEPGDFDAPDGPLTLEAWAFPRQHGDSSAIVSKAESSEFGLFLEKGSPSFEVHLDGKHVTARSEHPLEEGRWHHVAGVYDGREVRLYVGGRKAALQEGSGKRARNGLPLYVGADPNAKGEPVRHLAGALDEVRLSRTARYEGEAFAPALRHEPDEHTVLLFHCDRDLGPFAPGHTEPPVHAHRRGEARSVAGAVAPPPPPAASGG